MNFEQVVPILRIFSEEKAKEFYLDYLGCKIDWEHRFSPDSPLYMQVSRLELILNLSEHHGDGTPGSYLLVRMKGIKELHEKLKSKKYKYMNPGIQETPWGTYELAVYDPFRNCIKFSEAI